VDLKGAGVSTARSSGHRLPRPGARASGGARPRGGEGEGDVVPSRREGRREWMGRGWMWGRRGATTAGRG
jgi:hypothetical protein